MSENASPAGSPVLELDAVSFVRQGRTILDDVNLTIEPGQRWTLLGANGAGKSTILSMCGATAFPTTGTVDVLGRRLGRVDLRELRSHIGHVDPRHQVRRPLTVTEVVLTGATNTADFVPRWKPSPETVTRLYELIDLMGLGDLKDSAWPQLSQGERGRTLIARALVAQPELLLLDEPTTGLDVSARELLLQTVDDLHSNEPDLATVLVTHHLEELPASTTHAMLIKDGKVLASGDADSTITTELITECFDFPLRIERRDGRWSARAVRG